MTGTASSAGLRTLADDLRARTDVELAALLRARPDLASPVPADIAQLAARAVTQASTIRVLDRLDRFTLQVVDALVLLPDGTTPPAVRRLLGVPAAAVRDALTTLRDLAIVWGTSRSLHLVRVVRDVVGPHPAGLGPPLAEALRSHTTDRLATIATDLGQKPAGDRARDADTIARHLADRDTLETLLTDLGDDARKALEVLAPGPPFGRIDDAYRNIDLVTARTPVERLLATGLLVPVDDGSVVLPREVAIHLRGGVIHTDVSTGPPQPAATTRDPAMVDTVAGAAAFDLVRRIETLADAWAAEPPPVLRTGGLGVRDLRRLPAVLDVADEAAAGFVADLAHAAGLIGVGGEFDAVWLPTQAYDTWLRDDVADRWAALVQTWLTGSRVAGLIGTRDDRDRPVAALGDDLDRAVAPDVRRQTLEVLASLPEGGAPSAEDVVAAVRWSRPRRGGRLRDDVVRWTLREAEILGITAMHALASPARPFVDDRPDATRRDQAAAAIKSHLPEPLDHVLLQADLTAIAPGPLRSDVARELALVSEVESRGGASVHRFSAASIRRGLDAGLSAAEVHAFLTRISRTPVPQPLTYLVDDVARRHGLLRVGAASSFLRCDDEAVLAEILADPRTGTLGLRRIAPTVLASPLDGRTLLDRLRGWGYHPTPEGADGSVVVDRPTARRAASRPAPAPVRADRLPPSEAVLGAAVRALRAGDRSTSARPANATPGNLGRGTTTQAIAELRAAMDNATTVWIGYVDEHGSTTERLIDPIRLDSGWLSAFDHRSSTVRSFAVHRISAVGPVDAA